VRIKVGTGFGVSWKSDWEWTQKRGLKLVLETVRNSGSGVGSEVGSKVGLAVRLGWVLEPSGNGLWDAFWSRFGTFCFGF
jgi:hypothetical protein